MQDTKQDQPTELQRNTASAFAYFGGWMNLSLPLSAVRNLDLDVMRCFMLQVVARNTNASGQPNKRGKVWLKQAKALRSWKQVAHWRLDYLKWHTKHFAPKLP